MKRPGPIETKVAASGLTGAAVSLTLQLLAVYVHGFHAPPAATTALLVTVVTAVTGWLAPHTSRNLPSSPLTLTGEEMRLFKLLALTAAPPRPSGTLPPAVQSPATTTGPAGDTP